ncbi:acetolactate synthase small subunit [Mucilaginibacter terrae]|uniref:acetolactate synthase small subunit n=1 Tax=Mucilaginibacter terrae TaxID=1955052 RepID=UPI00363FDC2D
MENQNQTSSNSLPTGEGRGGADAKQEFNITVYTENQIGLLNRIAIIFTRRKINIDSLNTSPSEIDSIHRFTIVIDETEEVVRKVCRQIEKQVEVLKVYYHTNADVIWQEMALYKVSADVIAEKAPVERLLRENGARAVVIRKDYIVFETTGHREETENLIKVLQPYGLIEFVRSARVAIIKDSDGFNSKLREFEQMQPGEDVNENEYLNKGQKVFTM